MGVGRKIRIYVNWGHVWKWIGIKGNKFLEGDEHWLNIDFEGSAFLLG